VNLTRYQVELCVYGLRQLADLGPLTRVKMRPELRTLLQQLDDLLLVTCDGESESGSGAEELVMKDPINSKQAAALLECSTQWVRQIAVDHLGGRWWGSSWVFDRQVVVEYAERRRR
jgi:hypothetical protein